MHPNLIHQRRKPRDQRTLDTPIINILNVPDEVLRQLQAIRADIQRGHLVFGQRPTHARRFHDNVEALDAVAGEDAWVHYEGVADVGPVGLCVSGEDE